MPALHDFHRAGQIRGGSEHVLERAGWNLNGLPRKAFKTEVEAKMRRLRYTDVEKAAVAEQNRYKRMAADWRLEAGSKSNTVLKEELLHWAQALEDKAGITELVSKGLRY
jgi:hypothetical protein